MNGQQARSAEIDKLWPGKRNALNKLTFGASILTSTNSASSYRSQRWMQPIL